MELVRKQVIIGIVLINTTLIEFHNLTVPNEICYRGIGKLDSAGSHTFAYHVSTYQQRL